MERKKSWVLSLLSILVSAQRKHVDSTRNLPTSTIPSSLPFLWTYHLPKDAGVELKALTMPSCFRLLWPFFRARLCPLDQRMASPCTCVFVLDTDNVIRYVEYVDNINTEPDFEAAIAAVKETKLKSQALWQKAREIWLFDILVTDINKEKAMTQTKKIT